MQIVFLPHRATIFLCFIAWPILQVIPALICLYLPDRLFSPTSWFFKTHSFEKDGMVYRRVFRIHRWKKLLPDGGVFFYKRRYSKRHLKEYSKENLNRFLIESVRGETCHWLAIAPFWVFGFFTPKNTIWIMLCYAILVNFPCIIAQRYNRPRIQQLKKRLYGDTK